MTRTDYIGRKVEESRAKKQALAEEALRLKEECKQAEKNYEGLKRASEEARYASEHYYMEMDLTLAVTLADELVLWGVLTKDEE